MEPVIADRQCMGHLSGVEKMGRVPVGEGGSGQDFFLRTLRKALVTLQPVKQRQGVDPFQAQSALPEEPRPYHGYYFRLLEAQGKNAPGGAYYYVAGDSMIGGFAAVAYPASYGDSGITSFLVSHDGVVYEKDLGDDTERIAVAMTVFDPDDTWKVAEKR